MFKPHFGTCKNPDCAATDVLIPVKSGVCVVCNHKMKQAKKKFATKKPGSWRVKKSTGEYSVFEEIAAEREWVCFVTGEKLMALTPTSFSHVLPKALNRFPKFKHYKDNIVLLSDEIHRLWDFAPRSELKNDPRFDKLFELEAQLKEEYKKLYKNGNANRED